MLAGARVSVWPYAWIGEAVYVDWLKRASFYLTRTFFDAVLCTHGLNATKEQRMDSRISLWFSNWSRKDVFSTWRGQENHEVRNVFSWLDPVKIPLNLSLVNTSTRPLPMHAMRQAWWKLQTSTEMRLTTSSDEVAREMLEIHTTPFF